VHPRVPQGDLGEGPGRGVAMPGRLEVFSEQSPLGKAINGKKVGSSAKYSTPSGKTVEVKVLKAAPYTG